MGAPGDVWAPVRLHAPPVSLVLQATWGGVSMPERQLAVAPQLPLLTYVALAACRGHVAALLVKVHEGDLPLVAPALHLLRATQAQQCYAMNAAACMARMPCMPVPLPHFAQPPQQPSLSGIEAKQARMIRQHQPRTAHGYSWAIPPQNSAVVQHNITAHSHDRFSPRRRALFGTARTPVLRTSTSTPCVSRRLKRNKCVLASWHPATIHSPPGDASTLRHAPCSQPCRQQNRQQHSLHWIGMRRATPLPPGQRDVAPQVPRECG